MTRHDKPTPPPMMPPRPRRQTLELTIEPPRQVAPGEAFPDEDVNLFTAFMVTIADMSLDGEPWDTTPNTPEEQALDDDLSERVRAMMSKSPAEVRAERGARRGGQ